MGAKFSIEIDEINAATMIASGTPAFFVRMSGDDPELLQSRIHLIRLLQTKKRRVVSTYSQNIFGAQRAKKFDDISVTKTPFEMDSWLKLTPTSPLTPGEYGIVVMPKDTNLAPDAVYDFDTTTETKK